MYEYKARLIRVIDGDTIDADIDLGFGVWVRQRIKLYGINTADSKSKDPQQREAGVNARNKLLELLPREFVVQTILNKRGKFGRVLGKVFVVVDENHKQRRFNPLLQQLTIIITEYIISKFVVQFYINSTTNRETVWHLES